jgi:hypothetical protein
MAAVVPIASKQALAVDRSACDTRSLSKIQCMNLKESWEMRKEYLEEKQQLILIVADVSQKQLGHDAWWLWILPDL